MIHKVTFWRLTETRNGGRWYFNGVDCNKMPTDGSVTFSVKFGKRRKLVGGKFSSMPVSTPYGLCWEYFFIPNNIESFKAIEKAFYDDAVKKMERNKK